MSAAAPSWGRPFSPQGKWLKVAPADVRDGLRDLFARWGRPAGVRVDNGGPWGSAGDLPPDLALWLIGCGVDVLWNDPGRPQQNGGVERSPGTAKRWAEPGPCDSRDEPLRRLGGMAKL